MMKILNCVVTITVLIASCFLEVHATMEQPTPNSSHQTHLGLTHRNRNHHPHHYYQRKTQQQHSPQQALTAQRRHQRLGDLLNPSAKKIDGAVISNKTPLNLAPQSLQQRPTRLRRLSARDYSNAQRLHNNHRGNTEWNYHVYNALSNTFEASPSLSSPGAVTKAVGNGKGDDNTNDIEFISQTGKGSFSPNWNNNRRGFGFMPPHTTTVPSTHPPPPLVPARRGYVTMAPPSLSTDSSHRTDEPNETPYMDAREMEKRHICVQQRTITMPVKTTEVYARPIWKHVNTPCSAVQVQTQHPNQMCTRVQLVHEQAFRDVIRHKSSQQVTYDCCNGWERETPHTDGCMKPICSTHCQNGGTCTAADTCSCPSGFRGQFCEHDVNECKEDKPCDQTCVNTVGSYFCKCRNGFVLQADQQSCKKIDLQDDDAFEARDLENDIESSANEDMSARLQKIERSLANERVHTNELQKSLQATYSVVDTLKTRLNTIEKQQQDMDRLQSNLYATETRTNKLEGMLNLLMKCRNGPSAYCP